jgi:hypothetical protein
MESPRFPDFGLVVLRQNSGEFDHRIIQTGFVSVLFHTTNLGVLVNAWARSRVVS